MYNDYEDDETSVILTIRDLASFPPDTKVIEFRSRAILYTGRAEYKGKQITTAAEFIHKFHQQRRTYKHNSKK